MHLMGITGFILILQSLCQQASVVESNRERCKGQPGDHHEPGTDLETSLRSSQERRNSGMVRGVTTLGLEANNSRLSRESTEIARPVALPYIHTLVSPIKRYLLPHLSNWYHGITLLAGRRIFHALMFRRWTKGGL